MYRFTANFITFFTAGIEGDFISESNRKTVLINLFTIIAIIFFVFYTYRAIELDIPVLAIIYALLSIYCIVIFLFLRITKNTLFSIHALVFALFALEIMFLIRNGSTKLNIPSYYLFPGIYWYYIFPIFSLFSLGNRNGLVYNVLLIGISIIFFNIDSPYTLFYDSEFIIRFLSVYCVIFAFTYFSEFIREKTYNSYQKAEKENQILLAEQICHNVVLKDKNEQLNSLNNEIIAQQILLHDLNEELVKKNMVITDNRDQLKELIA
jgi:hypothetical protein